MAWPTKLKPETIERHARERIAAKVKQRADLVARLQAKASSEGPNSIWAEMLAEQLSRSNA